MRATRMLMFSLALAGTAAPAAESFDLDAPVPPNVKERTFLSPEQANAYRQAMEKVVGHWGILRNGVITVTTGIPASLQGTSAPVKIVIKDEKPVFNSVVSNSQSANAGLPVLSLSLAANEKATVTLTDTVQFLAAGEPTEADWAMMPASTSSTRLVFIDAAVVSVLQTNVMADKGGAIDGLLSVLKIGGKVYQAKDVTSTSTVISIGAKQSVASLLGGSSVQARASTESGSVPALTAPPFRVEEARLAPVMSMSISDKAPADLMNQAAEPP